MPPARALFFFLLSFVLPVSLLLTLHLYHAVESSLVAGLHKRFISESSSPRLCDRFLLPATMLSYEKTPMLSDPIASSSPAPMAPPTSTKMAAPATNGVVAPQHRHIWIITGPAGCGKTSVASYLAENFSLPYLEGDSVSISAVLDSSNMPCSSFPQFHPQANIDKMANNIPLTDADRWDWLILLREQAVAALESGASGVVLTCSALKRKYRDVIRVASYNDNNVLVHFVYLAATQDLLLSRVHARVGHYMKDSMVKSQFEALEPPTVDEKDVMSVDVSGDFESVQKLALDVVKQVMTQDAAIVDPVQS